MRATCVHPARAVVALAAIAAALTAGAAAAPAVAQPVAAPAQQFPPVTVKGERLRSEGLFSPFVYEALGATPSIRLPSLRDAAARPVVPAATATSPFVYEQLGATPSVRLPVRAPTSADSAR